MVAECPSWGSAQAIMIQNQVKGGKRGGRQARPVGFGTLTKWRHQERHPPIPYLLVTALEEKQK